MPVPLVGSLPMVPLAQLVERLGSDAGPGASRVTPDAFASLVGLVAARRISRDSGREVLSRLVAEGGDPVEIVEREGLGALDASAGGLEEAVARAIVAEPDAADRVRQGNMKAIGPIVGLVMRETRGRADGGEVTRLIRRHLEAG